MQYVVLLPLKRPADLQRLTLLIDAGQQLALPQSLPKNLRRDRQGVPAVASDALRDRVGRVRLDVEVLAIVVDPADSLTRRAPLRPFVRSGADRHRPPAPGLRSARLVTVRLGKVCPSRR